MHYGTRLIELGQALVPLAEGCTDAQALMTALGPQMTLETTKMLEVKIEHCLLYACVADATSTPGEPGFGVDSLFGSHVRYAGCSQELGLSLQVKVGLRCRVVLYALNC